VWGQHCGRHIGYHTSFAGLLTSSNPSKSSGMYAGEPQIRHAKPCSLFVV